MRGKRKKQRHKAENKIAYNWLRLADEDCNLKEPGDHAQERFKELRLLVCRRVG